MRKLLANLPRENIALLMSQVSQLEHGPHAVAKVDHPRLFRNHPDLRWSYRVHEQILPSLRNLGARVARTDIVITHDGFSDPGTQQPKVERNRRLLELDLRDNPTDGFILYNLGAVALTAGRLPEALDFLQRSLQHTHPGDTLAPKLHSLVVRTLFQMGDKVGALARCRTGRTRFPHDAELPFWEGVLCRESGDHAGAEACWVQVLQSRPGEHFTATDAGLKGYRTRHLLALLYRDQGRKAEAEAMWRQALAECPGFSDAQRQLAELLQEPRPTSCSATPGNNDPVPGVSLCMIVKNEAKNLPSCLDSVRDLVDEIIVVDTGSTDATKDVAARYGARVYDFAWQDNFAAARNESLRHATGKWIFWLDADESLDPDNRNKLRTLFEGLHDEHTAYVMKQHSLKENGSAIRVDHVRLFRRHPQVCWEHRIHEQLRPSLHRLGVRFCWTEVVIGHDGFRNEPLMRSKCERDLSLLEMEVKDHPNNLLTLFYLGLAHLESCRPAAALPFLQRCLEKCPPADDIARKIQVLLSQCRLRLGQPEEALAACQAGRRLFPTDPELLFVEAELRAGRGEHGEAEHCLRALLQSQDREYFTSLDVGLRGYKAHHNLALALMRQGKLDEAEAHWQIALKECPGFTLAWLSLGELYLTQKRRGDLDRTVTRLAALPGDGPVQADLLRARAHLARGKWQAARNMVERIISRSPTALMPRVLLCQTLLQEGKDWHAAERALRDVLALDPDHTEARHDLARLLQQQGRASVSPADLSVVTTSSQPASRPRVSLCLIVKNEEANLPDCLASAADLVDEIIVVDTGSTDATRQVAARFGARVHDFPWVDSFAAARNESLRHAGGEWVFWLDADDRLNEENRTRLKTLFAGLDDEKAAYVMKCLCLPGAGTGTATVVDHVRLYRNLPGVRWEHRVHEQVLPSLRRLGHEVRWSEVVIHHTGYQDPQVRGRKLERDLRLLHLEQTELPDHPFTLFNLGSVYQEMGRFRDALPLFRRSLDRSHPSDSIVRKLYALIASCHRRLQEPAEALAVCREGLRVCPNDAELLFLQAIIRLERKDLAQAEADLIRLLQVPAPAHFASVADGLRGYKARHNLGIVYRRQHKPAQAEAQWQAAVAECRGFVPAWLELGELYLEQQRWSDLDRAVEALLSAEAGVEAAVFRARGHLARREFGPARAVLAPILGTHPRAVWPRVILSHVLLQEGKNLDAAERTLHDILELDPGHPQARQNLKVLLRLPRRGQTPHAPRKEKEPGKTG